MQSGSSPEPGGGGRSAEPPPGPCESPPAAGARWLPLAPVLLPSLGNAINTQRKLPSVHQRRRRGAMTQHTGRTCSPYLNHGLLFSTWKSLGFPLGLFPLLHHLKANKGGKDEIKLIKQTVNLLSSFYPSHASEVLLLTGVKEKKKKCDIGAQNISRKEFPLIKITGCGCLLKDRCGEDEKQFVSPFFGQLHPLQNDYCKSYICFALSDLFGGLSNPIQPFTNQSVSIYETMPLSSGTLEAVASWRAIWLSAG